MSVSPRTALTLRKKIVIDVNSVRDNMCLIREIVYSLTVKTPKDKLVPSAPKDGGRIWVGSAFWEIVVPMTSKLNNAPLVTPINDCWGAFVWPIIVCIVWKVNAYNVKNSTSFSHLVFSVSPTSARTTILKQANANSAGIIFNSMRVDFVKAKCAWSCKKWKGLFYLSARNATADMSHSIGIVSPDTALISMPLTTYAMNARKIMRSIGVNASWRIVWSISRMELSVQSVASDTSCRIRYVGWETVSRRNPMPKSAKSAIMATSSLIKFAWPRTVKTMIRMATVTLASSNTLSLMKTSAKGLTASPILKIDASCARLATSSIMLGSVFPSVAMRPRPIVLDATPVLKT